MKPFLPLCAAILLVSVAAVPDAIPASARPTVLMEGLGHHHHPIATKLPEAQRFFDQGLTLIFGFNHDEAIRSFRRAAEIDPQAPMPWWGIALALGTNINMPADAKQERDAYEAVQKALALSKGSPENERAYIQALAERYSQDPGADRAKLALDYKNAMGELARRYPDDLEKNPRNGRSLFSLMESLKAQGKSADAEWVRREFKAAWRNADGPLRLGDL